MTTTILVNCGGGSVDDSALAELRAALAEAKVDATIEALDPDGIAARADALVAAKAPVIVAAGGDGTISLVASRVAHSDTALGILPLGTLNHLARDLGIPFDLPGAVAVLADGNRRTIDVAELNGRTFVNNSAIGLYPLMVMDRDSQQQRLGRSKSLAMLVASARTLWRFHDHRLRLRVDGSDTELVDTPLLFVGNNDYRLAFPRAGAREALDDGRLSVLVMRKKGVPGLIAATLRALVGLTRDDDMIRLEAVERLQVYSSRPHLKVSVDGETLRLAPPLDYRIRPGALTVIAPATPVPARPSSSTANSRSRQRSTRRSRQG